MPFPPFISTSPDILSTLCVLIAACSMVGRCLFLCVPYCPDRTWPDINFIPQPITCWHCFFNVSAKRRETRYVQVWYMNGTSIKPGACQDESVTDHHWFVWAPSHAAVTSAAGSHWPADSSSGVHLKILAAIIIPCTTHPLGTGGLYATFDEFFHKLQMMQKQLRRLEPNKLLAGIFQDWVKQQLGLTRSLDETRPQCQGQSD